VYRSGFVFLFDWVVGLARRIAVNRRCDVVTLPQLMDRIRSRRPFSAVQGRPCALTVLSARPSTTTTIAAGDRESTPRPLGHVRGKQISLCKKKKNTKKTTKKKKKRNIKKKHQKKNKKKNIKQKKNKKTKTKKTIKKPKNNN
jgi:hypothetical protein